MIQCFKINFFFHSDVYAHSMGSLILLQTLVAEKCEINLNTTKIYTLGSPITGSEKILTLLSQVCKYFNENKSLRDMVTIIII